MIAMPTIFNTPPSGVTATKVRSSPSLPVAKHRILHAFCTYPATRFETQSTTEHVILLLRAHPITQVFWIVTALIMITLSLFFPLLLQSFLSLRQVIFVFVFWYSLIFAYVFLNILTWLFNVGIITNERVVDVDFHGVLYKETTASAIGKIEDVTVKSGGFVASLFNFGNLFIQTAGTEANIEFINIPHPTEAAAAINNLMKSHHHQPHHGH